MDYFRGYRTFRDDPGWTSKMFIGIGIRLCSLFLPIVPTVVLEGWSAMALRRSVHGIETPLPRLDFDFDYLGKLLGPGFKLFIVRILWTLPMMFLFMSIGMCAGLGGVTMLGTAVEQAGDTGGYIALLCIALGMMLLFPLLIVLAMPATVACMRAELMDDVSEGLKVGEVLSMTKLLFKELFIGSLIIGTVQTCLTMLGVMLCYFPALGVMWLGLYVHAMFQADLYRAYLAKGGAPFSKLAPPELAAPQAPQYPRPPQQLPPAGPQGGW